MEVRGRVPDTRLGQDIEFVDERLLEPVRKTGVADDRRLPVVYVLLPDLIFIERFAGDAEGIPAVRAEELRVFPAVLDAFLDLLKGEVP